MSQLLMALFFMTFTSAAWAASGEITTVFAAGRWESSEGKTLYGEKGIAHFRFDYVVFNDALKSCNVTVVVIGDVARGSGQVYDINTEQFVMGEGMSKAECLVSEGSLQAKLTVGFMGANVRGFSVNIDHDSNDVKALKGHFWYSDKQSKEHKVDILGYPDDQQLIKLDGPINVKGQVQEFRKSNL